MDDETAQSDMLLADLEGFPEELLRNSILLFDEGEDSDVPPESEGGIEIQSVKVETGSPVSDLLHIEPPTGLTSQQILKREIAAYLKARNTASDFSRWRKRSRPASVHRNVNTHKDVDRKSAVISKSHSPDSLPDQPVHRSSPENRLLDIKSVSKERKDPISCKPNRSVTFYLMNSRSAKVVKPVKPLLMPLEDFSKSVNHSSASKLQIVPKEAAVDKKAINEKQNIPRPDNIDRKSKAKNVMKINTNDKSGQLSPGSLAARDRKSSDNLMGTDMFSMHLDQPAICMSPMKKMDMEMKL